VVLQSVSTSSTPLSNQPCGPDEAPQKPADNFNIDDKIESLQREKEDITESLNTYKTAGKSTGRRSKISTVISMAAGATFVAGVAMGNLPLFAAGAAVCLGSYIFSGKLEGLSGWYKRMHHTQNEALQQVQGNIETAVSQKNKAELEINTLAGGLSGSEHEINDSEDFIEVKGIRLKKRLWRFCKSVIRPGE